jgi:hypothetical protein
MNRPFASVRVNPFENDVVREPREVSFSVTGLNDEALNALVGKFSPLDADARPRVPPAPPPKAQLVVSPDRGYGKSHLLGRLFAKLKQRAATIYLRPFQDPNKAWQSILHMTIQELMRATDGKPPQLEMLAVAVLAHLGANFIGEEGVDNYADAARAVAFLRELGAEPTLAGAQERAWIEWLTDPETLAGLARRLRIGGFDLGQREKAWVSALAALARDERYGESWSAAVKWLRAEPLEPEEAQRLRLSQADNDGQGDSSPQEIDALSFRRLQGLCALASFHRPFVFCFDQTEFYVGDHALIKALGKCIERLYVDLRNQLTVITANQANWVDDIRPHMEQPHWARIDRPIPLEGIRKEGARELVVERLRRSDFDEQAIAAFFTDDWLERVFETLPELAVRELLMRAAERFRTLAKRPEPPPATIDALFQVELAAVRREKALQAYDQDSLMWFARDVGRTLEGASVERTASRRYFSLQWSWPDRRVCFAFEGGDHWKRWKSIAEEASALADRGPKGAFAAYVFRTPDLPKVPRPSWKASAPALDGARARGFRIVELTLDRVCELHAARELYSNALQGNIAFGGPETLAWLQARFASFLKELAGASTPSETPTRADSPAPDGAKQVPAVGERGLAPTQAERKMAEEGDALGPDDERIVLALVCEQKIVDIGVVLDRLGGVDRRDQLLRWVARHPSLKAHSGPHNTWLQWRIAP